MNRSLLRVCGPIQSQLAQSQQSGSPCSWKMPALGLWSIVLVLIMICGSAPAQLVKVLNSQNGVWTLNANVGTQTFDLNDTTTVFVVGLYGDGGPDAAGFNAVTFGGVPPTGFMNISGAS